MPVLFSVVPLLVNIVPENSKIVSKPVVVFEKEAFYTRIKREPGTFVGILRKAKPAGIGFGRHNPYRLEVTDEKKKKTVYEVYAGSQGKLFAPYVGKRISIVGKRVNLNVEGSFHREIRPGRFSAAPRRKSPEN